MYCASRFLFTISLNLHSELTATRHLDGVVCAHIHICLQFNRSSTYCRLAFATQAQPILLSMREPLISLLLKLVILLASLILLLHSLCFHFFLKPPASMASSTQSPLIFFFCTPPKCWYVSEFLLQLAFPFYLHPFGLFICLYCLSYL